MGTEAVKNAPTTEKVVIGGVAYIVTPEMAKALKEQEAEKQAEIDKLKSTPPPKAPEPVTQHVTPPTTPEKYGDKIFENPDEVLDTFGRRIKEEVTQELSSKYEAELQRRDQAQALSNFYTDFFKKHNELASDREFVEMIFERNYATWDAQTKGDLEAMKKLLADKATGIILKNVSRLPNERSEAETVLEGGGEFLQDGSPFIEKQDKKDEESHSLTSVLKSRKAARRAKS
jgi:hypothetical protein